jgi:hypothetical protein
MGMTLPAIFIITLVGAVLGFGFRVIVLIPAIASISVILAFAMVRDHSLWSVLLSISVAITALQIGYLAGASLDLLTTAPRSRRESRLIDAILHAAIRIANRISIY